ncbi:NUDIX domain-containing protein [Lewinella cohaerens]|uniref:NUDIX domain-containing protein n=1 Tax=Lewinella cohaerens TaxID=70995 RepID=UPI0005C79E91|nr:NUDIX hydrolase [Lewinella cohaerens]
MPVSVKGICFIDGKVVLLKNERNEWDLPGGKIGRREGVKTALKREIKEELGIEVQVEELLEVFTARVNHQVNVLIVLYLCTTNAVLKDLQISQESFEIGCFSYEQLFDLNLGSKYLYHLEKLLTPASSKEV